MARLDRGIVLWPGGALLVTVMTYRPGGVGVASDVLASRLSQPLRNTYKPPAGRPVSMSGDRYPALSPPGAGSFLWLRTPRA